MSEGKIKPKSIHMTVYMSNGQKETENITDITDIDSMAFAIYAILNEYYGKPGYMLRYKLEISDKNIISSKYLSNDVPDFTNKKLALETIISDCSIFCKKNNIQVQYSLTLIKS